MKPHKFTIIAPNERAARLARSIFPDAEIKVSTVRAPVKPAPAAPSSKFSFKAGLWTGFGLNLGLWLLRDFFFGGGR